MTALNLLDVQALPVGKRRHTAWLAVVMVASLLGGAHLWQTRSLVRLSSEVERLKADTVDLSRQLEESHRRARARTDLAARRGLIDKLARDRGRVVRRLADIEGAVAEGVWLSQLSYAADAVSLSGAATGAANVTAFLARLGATGAFSRVDLMELSRHSTEGEFRFGAKAQFVGAEEISPAPPPARDAARDDAAA